MRLPGRCWAPMKREKNLARELGSAISAARLARSWSQENLAERLEISKNHVGQLERGERFPSVPKLAKLALVLGISLDVALLGGSDMTSRDWASAELATMASIAPEFRDLATAFLGMLAARRPVREARRKPKG